MLTIFNRTELCMTFDLKEQARVCDILSDNKVEYATRTINRMSSSSVSAGDRSRVGTFGNDMQNMYEYIIYVRKADLEQAGKLI